MTSANARFGRLMIALVFPIFTHSAAAQPKPSQPRTAMIVRAPSGLSLRETPKSDGKRITVIPNESKVERIEVQATSVVIDNVVSRWTKVRFKDKEGWAFGGYLDPAIEDPTDRIAFSHPNIALSFSYPASYKVKINHFENYAIDYAIHLYPLKPYLENYERYKGQNVANDDVPPSIEVSVKRLTQKFSSELEWAHSNASNSNLHDQPYRKCSLGRYRAICYEWSGLVRGKSILALLESDLIVEATSMGVSDTEFGDVVKSFVKLSRP